MTSRKQSSSGGFLLTFLLSLQLFILIFLILFLIISLISFELSHSPPPPCPGNVQFTRGSTRRENILLILLWNRVQKYILKRIPNLTSVTLSLLSASKAFSLKTYLGRRYCLYRKLRIKSIPWNKILSYSR
jgi:cellulose synthase/poly-beta-1,6-N-acetylglucosamine synthase-like glycosyltransferase